MLHSERAVTSMAKWLVFLLKQITVCYPCVTNSESGHDRLLFTVECFTSCVAKTLFEVWKYFVEFISGFIVPEILPNYAMYISTLDLRSDQQTCERAAKLNVKAAFASLVCSFVSRNAHM